MTKNIKEKLGEFARLSINSINGALKYKGFKVKKHFEKIKEFESRVLERSQQLQN